MKTLASCFLCLFIFPSFALEVVLLSPSNGKSVFWERVSYLTSGAAEDLGIDLTVVKRDIQHTAQLKHIQDIVTAPTKPDFVIFTPYKESITHCFEALEKAQIPFVTLERVYGTEKLAQVGLPQVKYKYWLGEMYFDNVKASYDLSESLIKTAFSSLRNKRKYAAIVI